MGFQEDIFKLRSRVSDAVSKDLVSKDGKDFLEAALIQIMNEAERNRQNCITNAENLRKQAATFEGQAGAFASVSSIVFNVINGYVTLAEREEAERAAQEAEKVAFGSQDPTIVVAISNEPVLVNTQVDDKKTRKKKL